MSAERKNEHRYEIDSLSGRSIVVFVICFFGLLALSFWLVDKTLNRLNASTPPPAATSLVTTTRPINEAPHLQPTEAIDHLPLDDMEALKSHEDDVLARLGWSVDRRTHQAVISDQMVQHLTRQRPSEAGQ